MKNVTIILSLALVSLQTLASGTVSPGKFELTCKPAKSCLHASGLGYCVTQIVLSAQGNRGVETIHRRSANVAQEMLVVPLKNHVAVSYAPATISFRDREGDNWGQVKTLSGQLAGQITVDQDFPFNVVCSLKQ